MNKMLDFLRYIQELTNTNRLAKKHGFHPCTCTGVGYLEGMLNSLRSHPAFVCTTDTCEESTARHGGAWFRRRVFTVFILHRFNPRMQRTYHEAMDTCRELFRQFHSRFIKDECALQSRLTYLGVEEVRSRELGGQFLNGCTGLYFTIAIDEPIDLRYNDDEWTN